MSEDYFAQHLTPAVISQLETAAFRSLRDHLQERSDEVQNMTLMAVSGFCRNCLAKWLVLEARRLVDSREIVDPTMVATLNGLGYDEAAHYVYGMTVSTWKTRHQTKATAEMMEKYNSAKHLQAKHDKKLLETRETPEPTVNLASNVCCQDLDQISPSPPQTLQKSVIVPPPLPNLDPPPKIGVLTISDRAFRGEYASGDLAGPAVNESLTCFPSPETAIVPDDVEEIKKHLSSWKDKDLILTTGGTGLSPRDVTPEATRAVLDVECPNLVSLVLLQGSEPLASLSRGTAGIMGQTVVANLPGNPQAVRQIMPMLLPLLIHAVVDVRGS